MGFWGSRRSSFRTARSSCARVFGVEEGLESGFWDSGGGAARPARGGAGRSRGTALGRRLSAPSRHGDASSGRADCRRRKAREAGEANPSRPEPRVPPGATLTGSAASAKSDCEWPGAAIGAPSFRESEGSGRRRSRPPCPCRGEAAFEPNGLRGPSPPPPCSPVSPEGTVSGPSPRCPQCSGRPVCVPRAPGNIAL